MTLDLVLQAVNDYHARARQYALYRDYHDGKHRYHFASPRFRRRFGWVLRAARENLCPAVVAAHVDRLIVESWGNDDDAAAEGMSRLANLVHTEAHVSGDAFTITWKRPGTDEPMPVFHRADQVAPFVNAEQPDQLDAAAKLWVDAEGYARINLYDAEKLTRWRSTSKATVLTFEDRANPATLPNAATQWQRLNTDGAPHEEPHDFGVVPVCWWKRNAPSQFEHGVSILRDVISPQDRLNKVLADSVLAAERIALPLRYVLDVSEEQLRARLNPTTGLMEPPRNPLDEATDSLLMHTAKGPAGQFAGPNADYLTKMKNDLESEIGRITGVPAYYLAQTSGDVPSGESLRVVTSRLLSAVTSFQRDATPVWKGQMELLGWEKPALEWADPMPMDQSERLAHAETKLRLGYALEDAIDGLGEVDKEGVLARAEQARAQSAAMVGQAFRNGQIGY